MKATSLPRRVLAGAVGLVVGLGVAFAVTAPAQATGYHYKPKEPVAKVWIIDTCDGVDIKIQGKGTNRGWRISANGTVIHGSEHPSSLWVGGSEPDTFQTSVPAAEAIGVMVEWWRGSTSQWVTTPADINTTKYVINGQYVSNPEPHTWSSPGLGNGGTQECTLPAIEVIEDCEGAAAVIIHANDTRRTWKVDGVEKFVEAGTTEIFEASSIGVEVLWNHKGEFKAVNEDFVTRTPVDPEQCKEPEEPGPTPEPTPTPVPEQPEPTPSAVPEQPAPSEEPEDNGEGGGLPVTGASTGIIAGAALALLALGGGIYLVARRRRISFTA